jgi:adenylate cyclase
VLDANLKREIYEAELKKLIDESADLSKNINTANGDIENLSDTQTALEKKLSIVKQQMMSLAAQLEKKYEQESKPKLAETTESVSPPTGEIVIVFCDIEDSVNLWESMPEEVMIITLEAYSKILRDKLTQVRGYEVKSEGECFMAAFGSPTEAVGWTQVLTEEF